MDNVLGSIKNFSSPDVVRTRKVDVLNADGGGESMTFEKNLYLNEREKGLTGNLTYEQWYNANKQRLEAPNKAKETEKKGKQLGTGMFIVGAILTYYIVYKILKG